MIKLSEAELEGLERAIPPGPPGGELELGDAAISAFDLDCRRTSSGYELTCDADAFQNLLAFVGDTGVQVQAGLDEDLDSAIDKVVEAAEDTG